MNKKFFDLSTILSNEYNGKSLQVSFPFGEFENLLYYFCTKVNHVSFNYTISNDHENLCMSHTCRDCLKTEPIGDKDQFFAMG